MTTKRLLALALSIFLIGTGTAFAAPKGKIKIGFAGSVKTFDPHRITGFPLNSHYPLVFDQLLFRRADGKIVPKLAKSYKLVNPLLWEFKLQEGVKFSNGEDMDAHAVKFSLERIVSPKLKSRQISFFRNIKNVEVVNKYTVRVHLKKKDSFFLPPLTQYGQIVPPKYYGSKSLKHLARNPVGSGPYRLKKWKGKFEFHYEAHPNYWDKRYVPKIKTVMINIIPEPTTRVAALVAGDIDFADSISPQLLSMAKSNPNVDVIAEPSSRTCYIYPIIKPGTPWEKLKVRQALNYAIDKEALVKTVLTGYGRIIPTNVGPDSYGFNPALKPYPYDPAKAKKLLAEAGYPNGISSELLTPLGRYLKGKEVSEALVSMLAKVGIKLKLTVAEYGVVVTKMRARWKPKVKSFLRMACRMDSNLHSEHMYAGAIHSRSTWGGFRQKWMDKLIDDARSEPDDAKRLKKYQGVNKVILEKAIMGFLYQQYQIVAKNKKVNFKPRVNGFVLAFEMSLK
jgi:peptide/nickel transport system substrate-binding protein